MNDPYRIDSAEKVRALFVAKGGRNLPGGPLLDVWKFPTFEATAAAGNALSALVVEGVVETITHQAARHRIEVRWNEPVAPYSE
jgi:3-methyladenine DNA glycosylase/8-oxoguanine DNA glycosylase